VAAGQTRIPECVDAEYLHGGGHGKHRAADYQLVQKLAPDAEIWLGEGGGQDCASGSDTHQLKSNEMTDVYWWLDALGALARSGQQRWLRETLAGGWYGLVNLTSMEVYPDFYAALLFSKLMGPEVLAATVTTGVQYSPKAYAHCAREKG
jgi:heparanase 1